MKEDDLTNLIKQHHRQQGEKLDSHHKQQTNQINELKTSIRDIDTALRGSYEKKGLITKVHTLEKSEKTRKKITIAMITSALGSVIAAIWALLTK